MRLRLVCDGDDHADEDEDDNVHVEDDDEVGDGHYDDESCESTLLAEVVSGK